MTDMLELPLRERKKGLVRQSILENAERLFEARGYDHVTVAEIANAANVSVKTLFSYFRSKEDLLFHDTSLIEAVVAGLRARAPGASPADAVADVLTGMLGVDGLAGFQRGYGASEALRARLLRLWAEYEDVIAGELAREAGLAAPTADLRFHAVQLVALIRATTWPEICALAGKGATAVVNWLENAAARIKA